MSVLREISRLPDALHRVASALQAVAESQRDHAPSEERLDELERSRSIWEAEIEAGLLKADSKYKAAANAESRTRKQLEKLDPFLDEGGPIQDGIPPEYVSVSEEEGVQPLPLAMAEPSKRELAKRMKFMS